MASKNNLLLVIGLAAGIGYVLMKPKPRTLTLVIKGSPSNPPPDVKPIPKPDTTPVPIPDEYNNLAQVTLFGNQFALQLPSQKLAADQVAPLIVVIPPYVIYSDSNSLTTDTKKILSIFPKNLAARVFLFISNKSYGSLNSSGDVGKTLISGLKKLQELYPTNKVIVFGFGYGGQLAMYLAGSNAIDAAYIYGDYGNYNYLIKNPGVTSLYAWVPSNAVGDEWWKISQPVYSLYQAFDSFMKANYPTPLFLKGSGEQEVTAGELLLAAQKMISQKPYIPYVDDPGFKIEFDGNLDKCAIILKPENLAVAAWALTTTALTTARSVGQITSKDFWDIVDGFFNQINSKCTTKERYWDDAPDAMLGYLAIRSAIRALMNQGLMSADYANLAIKEAKVEAIKNGVIDNSEYLPGLKSDFES